MKKPLARQGGSQRSKSQAQTGALMYSPSGGQARIAFEVQLSRQTTAVTSVREQRYFSAGVLPFWLVNESNASKAFGSNLRHILKGGDHRATLASANRAVRTFLKRVESQVELARSVKYALKTIGSSHTLTSVGRIPAIFHAERDGRQQIIVLSELGPCIPLDELKSISKKQVSETIVQFHRIAPHLRGLGSYGFRVRSPESAEEVLKVLRRIFDVELVWCGRNHEELVEGALVGYEEMCTWCDKPFYRVPFVVIGHCRGPKKLTMAVHEPGYLGAEHLSQAIQYHDRRTGHTIGQFKHYGIRGFSEESARQVCPNCRLDAPEPLITAEDALSWPFQNADFRVRIPMPGQGWGPPSKLVIAFCRQNRIGRHL